MDLIKVFQRFPDHASCIEHLETISKSEPQMH